MESLKKQGLTILSGREKDEQFLKRRDELMNEAKRP
jgi:hypothetical protein